MTTISEQLRADFETWWKDRQVAMSIKEDAFAAYQAGRAVLQSPEIKALREDAERYRFIQSKVYASNAYGRASWKFHYDNLPLPLDNPARGSVKQRFEDAIDLAIRLEEDGNKC